MVQWFGLRTFTAVGQGSVPGQGTKIPQATQRGQNKQKNPIETMGYYFLLLKIAKIRKKIILYWQEYIDIRILLLSLLIGSVILLRTPALCIKNLNVHTL